MNHSARPAIFKWRRTAPELILCAVRWYPRYPLSLRDVEELLAERGLVADHTTIWRWVQRYGPELEQRLRGRLKSTNKSWRVDETYITVQGRWCYLYNLRLPLTVDGGPRCPVCVIGHMSGAAIACAPARRQGVARYARRLTPPLTAAVAAARQSIMQSPGRLLRYAAVHNPRLFGRRGCGSRAEHLLRGQRHA